MEENGDQFGFSTLKSIKFTNQISHTAEKNDCFADLCNQTLTII